MPATRRKPVIVHDMVTNEHFLRVVIGPEWQSAHVTGFKRSPKAAKREDWNGNAYKLFPKRKLGEEFNTYFCGSVFNKGNDERYHRRIGSYKFTASIMIDDIGPKVDPTSIKLPLSWKLETSPENWQGGYILDPQPTDAAVVNSLINGLVERGLAVERDPGMKSVTRYGRLPVGQNNKEALGEPFKHKLAEWAPENKYTIEEVADAYGIKLRSAEDKRNELSAAISDTDDILDALKSAAIVRRELHGKPGGWEIQCPWVAEHTGGRDDGAAYFEPGYVDPGSGDKYELGGFTCHHGHCAERGLRDIIYWLNTRHNAKVVHPQVKRDFANWEGGKEEGWLDSLTLTKDGMFRKTLMNASILIEHDPMLEGISLNTLQDRIVPRNPFPWTPRENRERFRDVDYIRIRAYLAETYDIDFGKDAVYDAVDYVADVNRWNPLQEYLNGLQWDGEPRMDSWLVEYAGVKDSEYTRAVGRKWLIGAVARALHPGCKMDYLLVLEGDQGVGKSRLVNMLSPRGDWYTDVDVDISKNKDAVSVLQGKWIVELGEMTTQNRTDAAIFKGFLSRQEDNVRLPYERKAATFPRRCVFVGTTNNYEYLRDETGNRRFWPVRCGGEMGIGFDLDGLASVRELLWAEATVAYYDGEDWLLPEELIPLVEEEQEARVIQDPIEDSLRTYLADKTHITINQIGYEVFGYIATPMDQRMRARVGAVLRRIGYEPRTISMKNVKCRGYVKK